MRKLLSDDIRLKSWLQHLAPGETLFLEGDPGRTVFVLAEGRVEVLRAGRRVAMVDTEEAFLGEIASLTGQPRSATVRALTPCTFLAVHDVEDLLRIDPAWGSRLARVLALRLRRIEKQLDQVRARAVEINDEAIVRLVTQIVNGLATALSPGPESEGERNEPEDVHLARSDS